MSRYAKEVNKLLIAIKNGDTSKFNKLFGLTANHLISIAKYYLDNKSYCEDVVNDAFIKIFKYIHSYDESKDGYNWMCKITENIAREYNSKKAEEIPLSEVETVLKHEVKISEEKLDLSRAIENLDPVNRELISQYYFFDRTFEDIGKDFNLTKSAVKKRIDKILIELRRFIEKGKH